MHTRGRRRRVELKMVGVHRDVFSSVVGGYVEKGAERKDPDGLARESREAAKPKLYAHEGYADAYLRAPA